MKIAVRYYSKTGNTKKLADAIATQLHVDAKDISEGLNEKVDILFLGSSVYWAGMDGSVKKFLKQHGKNAKMIVSFSTAALITSTFNQLQKLSEEAGLNLSRKEFHCRGEFQMLHKGKPDKADLKAVRDFAEAIVEQEEK